MKDVFAVIGVGWVASIITTGLIFAAAVIRDRQQPRTYRGPRGPVPPTPPNIIRPRGIATPARRRQPVAEGLGPEYTRATPEPISPFWKFSLADQQVINDVLRSMGEGQRQ